MNRKRDDKGFTLIEILIAIVVIGILSAVVVLGISSLTDKGKSTACTASADAAKSGAQVYYTNHGAYPTDLISMTSGGELSLPTGGSVLAAGDKTYTNNGWTLTMDTTKTPPAFSCS